MSFRNQTIRGRVTLLGVLLLCGTFLVGAVAFDRLLEDRLLTSLDQTLQTQATDRALAIDAGTPIDSVLSNVQRETAVAVFDAADSLLGSRGFGDPMQVATIHAPSIGTHWISLFEAGEGEIEHHDLRVAAVAPGEVRVVVAAELESVQDTLGTVRRLLALGLPALALAAGALLWLLTGRALEPVERLRLDAQQIALVGHGGRVAQPDTDDEISRLAETLNTMLDRLDENALATRRFVSDASHEIRSPIANIRARVETLTESELEVAREQIVGEVERVEHIIDDLTYLARSDEGHLGLEISRVELDDVMFAEAARLQQRGQVRVDASAVEPVVIDADLGQIRRVVRNLVDNAARHATTLVELSVVDEGDLVRIEVGDDGPGVPPENRLAVFERFTRLDEARERSSGGTGLGLAIVQDIVERHGGTIGVGDAAIGGALFTVRLPVD